MNLARTDKQKHSILFRPASPYKRYRARPASCPPLRLKSRLGAKVPDPKFARVENALDKLALVMTIEAKNYAVALGSTLATRRDYDVAISQIPKEVLRAAVLPIERTNLEAAARPNEDFVKVGSLTVGMITLLSLLVGYQAGLIIVHPFLGIPLIIASCAFYLMTIMKTHG